MFVRGLCAVYGCLCLRFVCLLCIVFCGVWHSSCLQIGVDVVVLICCLIDVD